jgi:hypothetical protein
MLPENEAGDLNDYNDQRRRSKHREVRYGGCEPLRFMPLEIGVRFLH